MEPSAREWVRRLRRGECSARALAERYLARIGAVNEALNAVVASEPERTLADADEADRRLERGDDAPLLGLPITVKDALDVEGFVSTGGSLARQGHRPERDATAVARLRAAGAVVLGKTNVPEFSSSYETNNALYGRTNNPIDPERTPGGSSGGEAAIIGADASPAGVGADGGGSIRVPCHYCGIVGLRPTAGRVPETGNWPTFRGGGMLDFMCVGPIGRFVADLQLLLAVISGPDLVDPFAVPVPLEDPDAIDVRGLRVGRYEEDGLARPTDGTRRAVERACAALAEAGCAVEDAELPGVVEATELFFGAAGADGGAEFRRLAKPAKGRHHPQFAAFLDSAPDEEPSAEDYFALQRRIFGFRARLRSFLGQYDAIVCPVAAGPAPRHDEPPGHHPREEYMAYEAFNYTHTWAVAGVPALVVPADEEDDLPVGVQVVSRPWREDIALAAGAALERALGGFTSIPAARRVTAR
jgi:amidase